MFKGCQNDLSILLRLPEFFSDDILAQPAQPLNHDPAWPNSDETTLRREWSAERSKTFLKHILTVSELCSLPLLSEVASKSSTTREINGLFGRVSHIIT